MTNCLLTLTDDVIWAPSAGQCTIKLKDRGQDWAPWHERARFNAWKNTSKVPYWSNFRIYYFVSQNCTRKIVKWPNENSNEWGEVRRVGVVYLDKIVRGIPMQVGINVTFHRLQQATEAEAHQERVVGVALFHDGGQLDAQALSEKGQVSRKLHDHHMTLHWCN